MLERETEIIIQILTESTIADRESITLNEILAANIPKAVKAYIQADVRNLLNEEITKSPKFSRVNRTAPGISQLERTLLRSLAVEYTFSRDEYIATTENAVHFVENFLCRPQWTLNQLMFERQDCIPVGELLSKLDYLSEYSYFGRLIEAYVRQKGWLEVTTEDFRRLIGRIDEEVIRQHNASQLALLTKPIYDFLLLSDAPMNRAIPLSPILIFFADKNLTPYKNYIERVCHIRSRSEISLAELIGIMEDLMQMEAQVSAPEVSEVTSSIQTEPAAEANSGDTANETSEMTEVVTSEVDQQAMASPQNDVDNVVPRTDDPAQKDEPQVEESSSQESVEDNLEEAIGDERPASQTESEADAARRNIALSLTYAGMAETHRAEPLPDINDIINGDQREKFIKKLFMKDEAYYGVFIITLNKTQTWQQATVYLD
ncbi:MAG: hypothetical protein HY708_07005, partial [Ignavibacteriae bacterium]|nr:hypothetical protein [Ignavibacteriota bacterium]